jgi:hypothetical protein
MAKPRQRDQHGQKTIGVDRRGENGRAPGAPLDVVNNSEQPVVVRALIVEAK